MGRNQDKRGFFQRACGRFVLIVSAVVLAAIGIAVLVLAGQASEKLDKPMYDHKQWPASFRYQHQNVAPGGRAAEDEAETRAIWGYPQPFAQ